MHGYLRCIKCADIEGDIPGSEYYKLDMQEAIQLGAVEGGFPDEDEPILQEATLTVP